MRITTLFIIFLTLSIKNCNCQKTSQSQRFNLTGEIIGKDTGSIVLMYNEVNNLLNYDTVRLNKGRFSFSGTVNIACEAILWTDIKNKNFDDSSVVRFLLEPKSMFLSYKIDDPFHYVITGSGSEAEKETWDKKKSLELTYKEEYYNKLRSLNRLSSINSSPALEEQLSLYGKRYDSISQKIRTLDIGYIKGHPDSYLSAYLLWWHRRRLSVDTIEMLFTALGDEVKKSSLGHDILLYVYPLTDDNEFRKANPLVDQEFDQRLSNIKSVYDLSSKDSSGNIIEFSSYKGKYLVIDFWASWCKPCIENIPALKKMIERYQSDSIQFISVSLDRYINDWKQSMIKHQFGGIQVSDLAGYTSLPAVYCKVLWVPKYVIADKNGRIINYDAPQPSEPGFKKLLDLVTEGNISIASSIHSK